LRLRLSGGTISFQRLGSAGADTSAVMYICICNAITDRQIVQAAEEGARSTDDLAHGLGVGLGCGRCTTCAIALVQETVAALAGGAAACTSPVPETVA